MAHNRLTLNPMVAKKLQEKPPQLRLLAQDAEDLAVLSAHMQDAVVRVCDFAFMPRQRRFAFLASRFDWLAAEGKRMERRQTGLHFDHVLHVARQGVDQMQPDVMLNLLGVIFEEAEAPAGRVTLTFSGGATIRLEVECVEAQMRDIGARWKTRRRPAHSESHSEIHAADSDKRT